MRHIYPLAAFLFAVSATAQTPLPFPDSAAIWTNAYYQVIPFPPPPIYLLGDLQSYCMNDEDTVINTIAYTRMHHCGGAYKGALRDDGGVVWYVPADSTQEFLLYDFTMSVGETAQIYFEIPPSFGMLTDVLVVGSYEDIDLGNRRVLQLESGGEWIEGIGARWGLFTEPWINISNYELRLECMSHADTILFPSMNAGPGTCDVSQGLHTTAAAGHITVSPNPTEGMIRCEGLTPGAPVQLTAADGRVLPARPLWNGTTAILDLGACAPGMYFLRTGSDPAQVVSAVLRR